MSASQQFRAARDFLLESRADCERACRDFRWPVLAEFNWVRDFFDTLARREERVALRVVADGAAGSRPNEFVEDESLSA